jgi:hypothetical protein
VAMNFLIKKITEILYEEICDSYLPDDAKGGGLCRIFADFRGQWNQSLV